jgi:hypothetical protein
VQSVDGVVQLQGHQFIAVGPEKRLLSQLRTTLEKILLTYIIIGKIHNNNIINEHTQTHTQRDTHTRHRERERDVFD